MTFKKRLLYISSATVIILAAWTVYSINQPPKWIGASQDGQWRADYNREPNAPKGDWTGNLYWLGDGEAFLVEGEFTKNGELVHHLENRREKLTKAENKVDYIHTWESMFKDNDHVQLKIYWEDGNGKHEDTIVMSPKTRYFAFPEFLYLIGD